MYKMNNLPDDIINHILEYKASYDHYLKSKKILKELPVKSTFQYFKNIINIFLTLNIDYYDFLIEHISEIEREHIIETLNLCNCCERHKSNRPSVDKYRDGFCPKYSTSNNFYSNLCKCSCRHIIRDICRAKNDEILDF